MAQISCPYGLRAALVVLHWDVATAFLAMRETMLLPLTLAKLTSSVTGSGNDGED